MECQNITKHLKINKNKVLGEVVILVEGESEEFKLLRHIFTNILDYNYLSIRRNKVMKDRFESKNNKNSTVIIANTSNSNIKSIIEDNKYRDSLYTFLQKEYGRSLKNVPIYILWDRDHDSNDEPVVLKSLNTFSNAQDNDYEMNGLLLLSYPCVESYELSNFDKKLWKKNFTTSKDTKKEMKAIVPNLVDITEKTLLLAVENMHRTMKSYNINEYDPSNFKIENLKIFEKETEEYKNNQYWNALSLISIMFIDLGIIIEKNN